MLKQYVTNRHLNEIHKNEQNIYLSKKLEKTKSSIDLGCPESFKFYEKEFRLKLPKHKCKNINYLINNILITSSKRCRNFFC